MLSVDPEAEHARAAQDYMNRKGYHDVSPNGCVPVEDLPCWYFYYTLPEGLLELEVLKEDDDYQFQVTSFRNDLQSA